MLKESFININGKDYKVSTTYKFIRSIRFRFVDDTFVVSAPYGISQKYIFDLILARSNKIFKRENQEKAYGEDYCYIFGEKQEIKDGFININEHYILYNKNTLYSDIHKYSLEYLRERVVEIGEKMGISVKHKVTCGLRKTQYGCNYYKSKTISFNTYIMHFNKQIIDSIVVHELAHDFERNHSQNFYNIVYKYCPEYKKLHKALRNNNFRG